MIISLIKRTNPRLAEYDYASAGAYFITICTKNRTCILSRIVGVDAHIDPKKNPLIGPPDEIQMNQQAAIVQLTPWGETVEKYLLRIPGLEAYVIMPNHVHFIMYKESGPMWASAPTTRIKTISDDIRSFKTLTSKEIGCSIWQRSFYDHIIRNEEDYYRVWQYIDENPIKWELDEYYRRENLQ